MMQIMSESDILASESAVALGFFDGVHLGHRAVIDMCVREAHRRGLIPCVFTFAASSMPVKQGSALQYIYSQPQKLQLLESCGIEAVYSPDFSRARSLDGETFCRDILAHRLHTKAVFCGRDFRFGAGARAGFDDLRAYGRAFGFSGYSVEPVCLDGAPVSSTRIRAALSAGNVALAGRLLGTPYFVSGIVAHGMHLGSGHGVPTLNLPFSPGQLVPRHGVFISKALVRGQRVPSVTDIGTKPTVQNSAKPGSETFLLDFSGRLYGSYCHVELLQFLRDEKKFADLDELYAQIERDTAAARSYFQTA